MEDYINLSGINKSFAETKALQNINLKVPKGDCLMIIGPNGVGKTTLLRLIGGLYYPDTGSIAIGGLDRFKDHLEIKKFTGYLNDEEQIICSWSGRVQIELTADIYGVPRNEIIQSANELISLFNLVDVIDKPPHTYSKGQLKKLALCTVFVSRAKLLLLDEPFTGGLDPNGHFALKSLMKEFAERTDITVIMTTQVPGLMADIAKRIAVIDKGEIKALGAPDEILAQAKCEGKTLEEAVSKLTSQKFGDTAKEIVGKIV